MVLPRTLWAILAVGLAMVVSPSVAYSEPSDPYQPPPIASGNVSSSDSSSVNQRWSQLLGNLLYFYDIQRAGTLPNDFRVSWRNDSVPNDGQDVGLDLSGGFFDAGNYIKATFPLCWTVTQLSWGAMMYGEGYDMAQQTPYLDATLRVALNWLLKASDNQDEMVVLIGTDDFYWGGDQNIPLNDRPSFVITNEKPGTDVFGSCASAMASASMLYSGKSLPLNQSQAGTIPSMQDSAYASTLLSRAQTLFDLAATSMPLQVYQKATSGVAWAYPSTDYYDELVLSSSFLALATGNQSYADYAQQTYKTASFPFQGGVCNWDQKTPATPVLLAQLAIAEPSMGVSLSKYQADAEYWFDGIINQNMPNTFTTPGGLFWFDGDSNDASLDAALNAAFIMQVYQGLASSSSKSVTYEKFIMGQVDYALGNNPMNTVYPVGIHPNSPQNPQSALASGGNNPSLIDTVPAQEAHVLFSGVVGGPDRNDNFYDQRSRWEQTEVALNCQSPLTMLVARQLVTGASDPFYVGMSQDRVVLAYDSNSGGGGGGLSTGAMIAIAVVVVVVVLGLLLGLAAWQRDRIRSWMHRRQRFSKV